MSLGIGCNDNFSGSAAVIVCDLCRRAEPRPERGGWMWADQGQHYCPACQCDKCPSLHAPGDECYQPDAGDL